MDTPLCDLMIGNIPGARAVDDPDPDWYETRHLQVSAAVETRRQKAVREEGMKPLKALRHAGLEVTRDEFICEQKNDKSLDRLWEWAASGKARNTPNSISSYVVEQGILYRRYKSLKDENGKCIMQAVVPTQLRTEVMRVGHDSLMGGHLGCKKTLERITSQFHWPGVSGDVRRHCISCDICQRTIPKGKVSKVPLGKMPLIKIPFR